MFPVEVGSLDSDTGESDTLNSVRSVGSFEPFGRTGSVREEEVKDDTEEDGDCS
jgi:hypothetical protein